MSTSAIAVGANVTLENLSTKRFNGLKGVCVGIAESGRYIVELPDKTRKLIKRENLTVFQDDSFGFAFEMGTKPLLFTNDAWAKGLSAKGLHPPCSDHIIYLIIRGYSACRMLVLH
jgi:hypothetical protein